jgi:hypothetical protein
MAVYENTLTVWPAVKDSVTETHHPPAPDAGTVPPPCAIKDDDPLIEKSNNSVEADPVVFDHPT